MIISILPFKPDKTSCADVGDNFPDGLALGAAIGRLSDAIRVCIAGWSGHLTANVFKPAETVGAIADGIRCGKTKVRGPGQNFCISERVRSLILTIESAMAISVTWQMRGLFDGLPLVW